MNSFITEFCIAPLQGYYSEALPTLARLKRTVSSLEFNVSERILGINRRANYYVFFGGNSTTSWSGLIECDSMPRLGRLTRAVYLVGPDERQD